MRLLPAASLLLLQSLLVKGQQAPETRQVFQYQIAKTASQVLIDGKEEDPIWDEAEAINGLYNHWPTDTGKAAAITHVKVAYDENFMYLLAISHDQGERIIQSLKRDADEAHWNSDNFTLVLDPMNNKQNGFMFGVNAGGAQIEAQLNVNGVRTNYDQNWDNKWYSAVEKHEDHWVVEMAIPFKTLRYNPDNQEWGINFIRGDMQRNAYATWTQFPLNFGGIDLNYMGTLQWPENPPKANGKVVLIPYIAGGTSRDFEEEEQQSYEQGFDVGIDAKIAITGSLNLDVTLNPDFSNVDVDQQVTNLSRFSISFPERRNFFLENGDIFSNFGSWEIQPFFSRTIGLNEGEQIPITYGARLTGNLTKNTRIGVMNVQTRKFEEFNSQNYSVAAVHHQVLARSVIKGIFINRQVTGSEISAEKYARNGGLEFSYVHPNGKLNNTFRLHGAITDEKLNENLYYGFNGNYNTRNLRMGWTLDFVGENYITELGFNPRLDNYDATTEETTRIGYTRINPWVRYLFYPKNNDSKLTQHGLRTWHMVWLNEGSLNERRHGFGYDFLFKNTSEIRLNAMNREVNLPVPTDLIDSDTPLPVANYRFTDYLINYNTDRRKALSTSARLRFGDFFNGTRWGVSTGLNFRVQPWGVFGVNYEMNEVKLAEGYGDATLHLFRANAEINFSNTMSWTSAIQYNSQSQNYNVFSRFQWRYKPMSDFFLVYTDNYTSDGLNIKNRQIVFKLTYWLNM